MSEQQSWSKGGHAKGKGKKGGQWDASESAWSGAADWDAVWQPTGKGSGKKAPRNTGDASPGLQTRFHFGKRTIRAYADATGSCLYTDMPGEYRGGLADTDFVKARNLENHLSEWNSPVIKTPGVGIGEALANFLACAGVLAEVRTEERRTGEQGTVSIPVSAFQKLGLQGLAEVFMSTEGIEMLRAAEALSTERASSLRRSEAETHAAAIVACFKTHKARIAFSAGRLAIASSRLYLGAMSALEVGTQVGNPKKWAEQVAETALKSKSLDAWKCNPKNDVALTKFIAAAFMERSASGSFRSASSNAASAAFADGGAEEDDAEEGQSSGAEVLAKKKKHDRKRARSSSSSASSRSSSESSHSAAKQKKGKRQKKKRKAMTLKARKKKKREGGKTAKKKKKEESGDSEKSENDPEETPSQASSKSSSESSESAAAKKKAKRKDKKAKAAAEKGKTKNDAEDPRTPETKKGLARDDPHPPGDDDGASGSGKEQEKTGEKTAKEKKKDHEEDAKENDSDLEKKQKETAPKDAEESDA